jgi:hypothetical protein
LEPSKIASRFCLGGAFGLAISLAPLLLIQHRQLFIFFSKTSTEILMFCPIVTLAYAFAALKFPLEVPLQSLNIMRLLPRARVNIFAIAWSTAVFLYIACAILCAKLNLASLPIWPNWQSNLCPNNLSPDIGLILISFGLIRQIASLANEDSPDPTKVSWVSALSHPLYSGWLLFLLGVSLLFSTWFPLIALPGLCAVIKWHLDYLNTASINSIEISNR